MLFPLKSLRRIGILNTILAHRLRSHPSGSRRPRPLEAAGSAAGSGAGKDVGGLLQMPSGTNTMGSAYQIRLDDRLGAIEVGKLADLVALEKNPSAFPLA